MSADTQRPRVMADEELPNVLRERLSADVELVPWNPHPGAAERDVSGIFTFGHRIVDDTMLAGLPALKVVSNHGVGVDHIDVEAAERRGILVGNTPGVLDGAVADLAFALLLAAARRLPESAAVARNPATVAFDQMQLHGQEVHGSTLGIVGLGRIGAGIARRARGFDMQVLYHNRRPQADVASAIGAEYVSLEALLRSADFVILCVPLSESTRRLIGAKQLGWMKPSAVLINVARGPVVDTDALVTALNAGQLWAAALDVTDPEPLPRNHPLLSMPNVLVTSHIGSASLQTRQRMADMAVENLLRGLELRK